MKRTLLITALVLGTTIGATGTASSQTMRTDSLSPHIVRFNENVFGVGLAASLCSGMGLSFKHHLANIPFAYQLTGGVIKLGDVLHYSIGSEFQYDLSVATTNRLYAVLGLGEYYDGSDHNERLSPFRFGVGVGYEMAQSNAIGLSLNLMITDFTGDGTILPLPSVGVHYYFK